MKQKWFKPNSYVDQKRMYYLSIWYTIKQSNLFRVGFILLYMALYIRNIFFHFANFLILFLIWKFKRDLKIDIKIIDFKFIDFFCIELKFKKNINSFSRYYSRLHENWIKNMFQWKLLLDCNLFTPQTKKNK